MMPGPEPSYDFLSEPTHNGDLGMLGHYRVIAELGRGGMGFVFRAEDVKLKRSVALKVMNQKIAAVPFSRKRFLSEARAMAAVHHDNVVTIFEVGESKGTPFMAMEMLAGRTLEQFNKSNPSPDFKTIIAFATQTARGLAAAHAKGIVHRDIKPANIWIQEGTNRVKILDFGLALASSPVDQLAGRGAVLGTPGYLSPEQARSDPMDDRSDLYSLGVVLYEMCTGKLPIQAKTVPGQLISILTHRPQPISELNPNIPKPLCNLIHKLLRKEPRSRVESADALQVELARVEIECEKTTETAQAINRLKEGLSEVVTKKSASVFEDLDDVAAVHDPLAMPSPLPGTLPAVPAMNPAMMVPPVGTIPAVRTGAAKKRANAATAPAWQAYLPLIAIVAVVLIALPILTFAFSGAGRSTEAYIVDVPNNYGAQPSPVVAPEESPPKPNPKQQKSNSGNNQNKPKQNNKQGRQNGGAKKEASSATRASEDRSPSETADEPVAAPSETTVSSNVMDSEINSPKQVDATDAPPQPDPIDELPDTPPPAELRWEVISTADGRGADTSVQRSGGDPQGNRPSVGVRTRNGVEVNHIYLRFDLSSIEDVRSGVKKAGLILTLVGSKPPIGANVRVYGIAEVGMWDEEKLEWGKTPSSDESPKQLRDYELLADISVDESVPAGSDGKNQIRISDPRLTNFVAQADDLVTLALAGDFGDAQLRFVSKEKSKTEAPQLLVEVPLKMSR